MFDDFFDNFGWEYIGMAGALAEEMAEEEKERQRLEQETATEESDCSCEECDSCDSPEEPFEPRDEDPYP